MNRVAYLVLSIGALGQTQIPREENLHYSVNWPSGLSLGEAELRATRLAPENGQPERWQFELLLDASIPGFQIAERYRSTATTALCSIHLDKKAVRGKRKTQETSAFDAQRQVVVRQTIGGGKSEAQTAACARDALTFIQYVRREVAQGRLPPRQKVYLGAAYDVGFRFGGAHRLTIGGEPVEAERLIVSFKGPASELTFDLFLARDPARTPVLVRGPLAMGTFSMELMR
jgi:hypothetical protein